MKLLFSSLIKNNFISYARDNNFDDVAKMFKEIDQENYDKVWEIKNTETKTRLIINPNIEICNKWFLMIEWIYCYYQGNIKNYSLQYNFHKHPILSLLLSTPVDVNSIRKKININIQPLTPVKSLVSVISYWNLHLVSRYVKEYLLCEYNDLFPRYIEHSYDGASRDYLSIVMVPFIQYERIKKMKKLGILDELEKDIKNFNYKISDFTYLKYIENKHNKIIKKPNTTYKKTPNTT
jgi:hypothetical protein